MTAQFNDLFLYRDIEFALAGVSEGNLFDPAQFELHPIAASTACWRRYIAFFALSDSYLILDRLFVNLPGEGTEEQIYAKGPSINGIRPLIKQTSFKGGLQLFNNHYENLNYRLDYTGGLLLGHEFIRELYVHMGFHPAWKYKTVIELIFENGLLTRQSDRSERMAEFRQRIQNDAHADERKKMPTREEISEFVEHSFDRTYTPGE